MEKRSGETVAEREPRDRFLFRQMALRSFA